MRYVIIGAGPTGLGAAWKLNQEGADWSLYEAEPWAGGLSASFLTEGFTWDLGGHILFSHYPEFDKTLNALMPSAQWHYHERRAFIRFRNAWVPYPFQHNLHHLPKQEQAECLQGLAAAAERQNSAPTHSFLDLILRSMGDGLARHFMVPYNTKVWAYPPSRLGTDWTGERIAIPDLARIRRNIAEHKDDVGWGPNNLFRFPAHGGTGAIWRTLANSLPRDRVHFSCAVTGIDTGRKQVHFANGRQVPFDVLVSTMPLNRLASLARLDSLTHSAAGLLHTSTHVIGVGLPGPVPGSAADKCWLYFPEEQYPFYRVTVFSNYSRFNGYRRMEYGYPVPTVERDEILKEVLPALEVLGIYSRGRFGAWKYEVGNMDHSFMQGAEVVGRLLACQPERTLTSPGEVNRLRMACAR